MHPNRAFFGVFTVLLCLPMVSAAPGRSGISGRITLNGQPAKPEIINMSRDPSCGKSNSRPAITEEALTGPGGALANVVVYVSSGAPAENAVPDRPKTLDQKGCRYMPHVLAVQANQEL